MLHIAQAVAVVKHDPNAVSDLRLTNINKVEKVTEPLVRTKHMALIIQEQHGPTLSWLRKKNQTYLPRIEQSSLSMCITTT